MRSLKQLLILMFLLWGFAVIGQQSEVLTNETVIGMYAKGLPASIISARLKTAKNAFDISTEALIKLTESKIPEDLINAMIDAAGDPNRHFVKTDPNNPMDMHDSGIYLYKKSGETQEIVPLEPTVYSQSKSGGALASALT